MFEKLEARLLLDGAFPHGGLGHFPTLGCDVSSVQSGAWSAPTTWSGGQPPFNPPADGGRVCITAGNTVVYDRVDAVLNSVDVHGSLVFLPDVNTSLRVGTLLVEPDGWLDIEPATDQVLSEIVTRDLPINTATDPEQFSDGLIGLGRVTIRGAAKESYVEVAAEPHAGDTSLTLQHTPVGWHVGDRIVLPSSDGSFSGGTQWEERTIAGLSGSTVTLSSALAYNHPAGRDLDGNVLFLPHVMDLTRNVVIRSENPNGVRGHTMFVYRAQVDIEYAAFKDLGRTTVQPLDSTTWSGNTPTHIGTNQIGRYALHMHHVYGPLPANPDYQFKIVGNAIDASPKWGIAIHDSHFGLVQANDVYAARGAGIVTEDASETGNVIEKNFVLRADGSGEGFGSRKVFDHASPFTDFGHEGAGFWFRGGNNYVRDNIAADASASGMMYYLEPDPNVARHFPLFPGADTTVAGQYSTGQALVPLQNSGNESYRNGTGLFIAFVGDAKLTQMSNFDNFSAWNNRGVGVGNLYSVGLHCFDNLTVLFQTGVSDKPTVGFNVGGSINTLTLVNPNIQGANTGIIEKTQDATTHAAVVIYGGFLRNDLGILATMGAIELHDVVFAAPPGMPLRTVEYYP